MAQGDAQCLVALLVSTFSNPERHSMLFVGMPYLKLNLETLNHESAGDREEIEAKRQ